MTNFKFSPEGIHTLLVLGEEEGRYIEVHTHPTEVTEAFMVYGVDNSERIPYSTVYTLIQEGAIEQTGNTVQNNDGWQVSIYKMAKGVENRESPTMHVYGQSIWHDDVNIVGNREALERLQEAISRALDGDTGTTGLFFAKDGEGYEVAVTLQDGECHSKEWEDYVAPYTDEAAREVAKEGSIIPLGISGFARKGKSYEFSAKGMKEWKKDQKNRK